MVASKGAAGRGGETVSRAVEAGAGRAAAWLTLGAGFGLAVGLALAVFVAAATGSFRGACP
jgi:hypothetical protein